MINAVLVFNNAGQPRLTKFYTRLDTAVQQRLIQEIFTLVAHRPPSACNFLPLPPLLASGASSARDAASHGSSGAGTHSSGYDLHSIANEDDDDDLNDPADASDRPALITYRHYATLYFMLISTSTESPLALLDLIQVFVEALDRLFADVCELDLIFNYETLHVVLGEMIVGGIVVETSLDRIVQGVRAQGAIPQRREMKSAGSAVGGLGGGLAALGWGGAGLRGV